jgi:hypothetical protein
MELKVDAEEKRRTLSHAPHPNMTLKSAVPGVKATSRSSTARPQKKEEILLPQQNSSCAGLTRVSTYFPKSLAKKMDCRSSPAMTKNGRRAER